MFEDFPWVTIVVAIIGLVSAFAVAKSTNRKYHSEGADAISQAAVRLVTPLQERLDIVIEENLLLQDRLDALEAEARNMETIRFENQHLKERVKYLELQVEVMKESNKYDGDIAELLASEKMRLVKLEETVEALRLQVIELGGWPVNEPEE